VSEEYMNTIKKYSFFIAVVFFTNFLNASDIKNLAEELSQGINDKTGIKLAVFSFPYYDGSVSIGSIKIQEELTSYLAKNKNIDVLERTLISKLLEEKKMQMSGLIDDTKGLEFGKLLGADAIVTGIIEDISDNKCRVNSRVIDVRTGKVLSSSIMEIERNWEEYKAKVEDKNIKKETPRIIFEISPEAISLQEINQPEIPSISETELDFNKMDIDKLSKYDEIVRFEKNETDINKIIQRWEAFSNEVPEYRDIALKRVQEWKDYIINQKKYEEALEKKKKAMEEDYAKLDKLLKMDIISAKDKSIFVESFWEAYVDNGDNKYYNELVYYRIFPCVDYNKNKIGFCDYDGSIIMEGRYDDAYFFSEGLALVKLNNKWGFIDKSGREVIPLKYDNAWFFSEGLASVKLNNKWGFIDKSGREVIPLKYDDNDASFFSEGLAQVKLNNKLGFVDKSGREIIPLKYDYAGSFSEGLALVELNDKYGFIDKSGREVIPLKYDYAGSFSEGLAPVKLNYMWGFIDKSGREVIPLKYENARSFSEGLAPVKLNCKWGFIDKSGKEIRPLKYDELYGFSDEAYVFSEGLAQVELNGKQGYVDHFGREYFPD
jgi:TolB-like protein